MEFGHDLINGLGQRFCGANQAPAAPGLDWRGLHARLAAAHAARRELLRLGANRPSRIGGFNRWSAVTQDQCYRSVNRIALADGKQTAGKQTSVTGSDRAGDRG